MKLPDAILAEYALSDQDDSPRTPSQLVITDRLRCFYALQVSFRRAARKSVNYNGIYKSYLRGTFPRFFVFEFHTDALCRRKQI